MKLKFVNIIVFVSLLTSCMGNITPEDVKSAVNGLIENGYQGCVSATALDNTRIKVEFSFPLDATEIEIYRDGYNVLTSHNSTLSSFIDTGLEEGETYNYVCIAKIDGKYSSGVNDVTETTLIVTAPIFTGISSASIVNPTSVVVTWPPTVGGSKVSYFKVYAGMVNGVDFTSSEKIQISTGSYSTVLSSLADDMPYSFAVRACNAADICDSNIKEINLTTPDKGRPTTTGPSSFSIDDSKVLLNIPWVEANGAVSKRRVFRSINADGTAEVAVGVIDVIATSDLSEPSLTFEDALINENTTYYYFTRDEDPSGNITDKVESNILKVDVGDLTNPIFTGLTAIGYGADQEGELFVTFSAIGSQPSDPAGAENYLLFETYSDLGTPVNPCLDAGVVIGTFPATNYSQGVSYNIPMDGKLARRRYSYCMQAVDAAGNRSKSTSIVSLTMKDLSPPVFDGIQGLNYDNGNDKFDVIWNASNSEDLKNYRIKIWKNTTSPTAGQITQLYKDKGAFSVGASFDSTDFSYSDGDTVYAVADACDNAGPTNTYNTQDNCTTSSFLAAKYVDLADQTAPVFSGTGLAVTDQVGDGVVKVSWTQPADLSDFAGFRIYNLQDGTKDLVKNCPCSALTCPLGNEAKECVVTGLSSYRTYSLFVSAYDVAGNESQSTIPVGTLSPRISYKTDDESAPAFASNLSVTINGGDADINWDLAIDNQYSLEPGSTIEYKLYRKQATGFSDITKPWIDGVLIYTGTVNSYNDPLSGWNPGDQYYFVVCAQDQYGQDYSNNITCDGNINRSIADNVAPTISGLIVDEEPNSLIWTLKGIVSDNVVDESNVSVSVYRKFSNNKASIATTSDTQVIITNSSPGLFSIFDDSITGDVAGDNRYVHYLVVASDLTPNISQNTYTKLIKAPAFKTVTSLSQNCIEDIVCSSVHSGESVTNKQLLNGAGLSGATVFLKTLPNHGTVTNCFGLDGSALTDVNCIYTPVTANFNGTDSYQICAKDAVVDETVISEYLNRCKIINVNISAVNDNPTAVADIKTILTTDGTVLIDVLANDSDLDGDTGLYISNVQVTDTATKGTVTNNGNNISYTPNPLQTGADTFSYTLSDGVGGQIEGSITVKIMTKYTWTGNGGDNNWSNLDNWCGSINISGNCAGANIAPAATDDVYFDSTCTTNCDSVIDTPHTINNFYVLDGYEGAITHSSNIVLQNYLMESGTFLGGAYLFDIKDQCKYSLSIHGGDFTAPSGTLSLQGWFEVNDSVSGTVFTHNNGIVKLIAKNAGCERNYVFQNPLNLWNLTIESQWVNPASDPSFLNGRIVVNNEFSKVGIADGGASFRKREPTDLSEIQIYGNITMPDSYKFKACYNSVSLKDLCTNYKLLGSNEQTILGPTLGIAGFEGNVIVNKPAGSVIGYNNIYFAGDFVQISGSLDFTNLDFTHNSAGNKSTNSITLTEPLTVKSLHLGIPWQSTTALTGEITSLNSLRLGVTSAWDGSFSGGKLFAEGDISVYRAAQISTPVFMVGAGDQRISRVDTSSYGQNATLTIDKSSGTVYCDSDYDLVTGVTDQTIHLKNGVLDMQDYTISSLNLILESGTIVNNGTNYSGNITNNGGTFNP